ncbi:MAG: 4Fe-4S binding protein, partial [Candidatus Hydrogenedentota bacterium]
MLFLLLLLSAPLYQIVRTFRQDPYPYPESPVIHFAFLRTFLQNYDHTIRNLLGTFFTNISGGPYSLKFFSIKIVEPFTAFLNAVRNSFSPDVWTATMFLSFSLPLLAVFLFGRFYCGYICPMSLFVSENLRLQQRFLGRIPSSSASPEHLSSRFLLLFALPLFLLLLFRPSFLQFLLLPALLQNAWSDFVLFGGFSLWSLLLLLVFVFEILFPGTFCRRLCPTGLFLGQAGRYRLFRLGYQRGISCIGSCTVCNEVCWLGLEPKTRAEDPACDLCMRCAGQCPQGRLKLFLPLSLILILLFPSPNASASEWDERTAYDLSVTLLPLAEG